MINLYSGATRSTLGATYLDVNTYLNIREGYNTGNTTEYVTNGPFLATSLVNSSTDQVLSLDAIDDPTKLGLQRLPITKTFRRGHQYNERFDDPQVLGSKWVDQSNANGWGITTGFLRSLVSGQNNIEYSGNNNLADVRVIVNARAGVTALSFHLIMRSTSTEHNNISGYMIQFAGNVPDMRINRAVNSSFTLLQTASVPALPAGTIGTFMFVFKGRRIRSYMSTDGGMTVTAGVDYEVEEPIDLNFQTGSIGIRCDTQNAEFTNIDIVELYDSPTVESVVKKVGFMGGINNIVVQDAWAGATGWLSSTNSTFTLGITNGYSQVDLTTTDTGSSWHMLTSGISFSEFTFECDIFGVSGNYMGIFAGLTNNFYGNYHYFGAAANEIENYINGRFAYRRRGEYFLIGASRWYNFKLTVEDKYFNWYMNGQLVNSIYGASLSVDTMSIGLFAYRTGSSSQRLSWRNIKVSQLDDTIDDVTIDANNTLKQTFDRYIPDGFAVQQIGSTTEIFAIGTSRGQFTVNNYIASSTGNRYYNEGFRYISVSGRDVLMTKDSINPDVLKSLETHRFATINDQSISTVQGVLNIARRFQSIEQRQLGGVDIQIINRPMLQQYDQIIFTDTVLGVSQQYIIGNISRSWSVGSHFNSSVNLYKL